jgi:pimeloyl-ACP methyl ester carboxylesterase
VLEQAGVERAVVVGHDFGGPVAAHLYRRAPERVAALALLATNVFPDTPIPFPLTTLGLPGLGGIAERLLFSRPSLALMVRQGIGTPGLRPPMNRYIADQRAHRSIATIFAASLRRLDELYNRWPRRWRPYACPL